jgi:hypothetical protein
MLSDEEIYADGGWPVPRPEQSARIVSSPEEFVDILMYGSHIDEIYVLPNGLYRMQQRDNLPQDIRESAQTSTTVLSWLSKLDAERLDKLKGDVFYQGPQGEESEVYKCSKTKEHLYTLEEKRNEVHRRITNGDELKGLYVKEMRFIEKYRHPVDNEWVKTVLSEDMKDYVGIDRARVPVYWDRYSEGVFIGNRCSGSPMHVDQCLWSNVGKNWQGYKLFALWRWDDEKTNQVMSKHYRRIFTPPLSTEAKEALATAVKVCIVRPGDVFVFSGANPHMAVVVTDELSVTAYESFVNVNPRSIQVFCSTSTDLHWNHSHMREDDLRDLKHDVMDLIEVNLERLTRRKRGRVELQNQSSLMAAELRHKKQSLERKDDEVEKTSDEADPPHDWPGHLLHEGRDASEERKAVAAWERAVRLLREHDPFYSKYVYDEDLLVSESIETNARLVKTLSKRTLAKLQESTQESGQESEQDSEQDSCSSTSSSDTDSCER